MSVLKALQSLCCMLYRLYIKTFFDFSLFDSEVLEPYLQGKNTPWTISTSKKNGPFNPGKNV